MTLIEIGAKMKYNIYRKITPEPFSGKSVMSGLTPFYIANANPEKRNLFCLWHIRHSPLIYDILIPIPIQGGRYLMTIRYIAPKCRSPTSDACFIIHTFDCPMIRSSTFWCSPACYPFGVLNNALSPKVGQSQYNAVFSEL